MTVADAGDVVAFYSGHRADRRYQPVLRAVSTDGAVLRPTLASRENDAARVALRRHLGAMLERIGRSRSLRPSDPARYGRLRPEA
jgi:hypothetical protein